MIFSVEGPDGKTLKIEGPADATDAELISTAQEHYTANAPKPPVIDSGALAATLQDLPRYGGMALQSVGTGAMDLGVGAGQIMSKVVPDFLMKPLTGVADRIAGGSGDVGPSDARYSDYMRNRERSYQQSRAGYEELPDVGRFTGQVLAGSVLAAGPTVATLPGRMMQGAKVGTVLGLASPVDPDAGSYATSKAVQTGGGALVGAVAPVALEGLVRGAAAAVNAIAAGARGLRSTVSGQTSAGTIQQTLQAELQKAGVDWQALPVGMRNSLVIQVQNSLKAGGELDPQAVSRLADFYKINIQPTQGQVTRDPLQFAREQNYSKLEPGRPLAERLNEQNRQLITTLDDARGDLGASPDNYTAGQAVISNLQGVDAKRKAAVDTAYAAARNSAGIEADVPLQPVAQRLGQVIEDFGDDKIPAAVMRRLQDFGLLDGKQTRVFNIREAEKLKTLISNNIDNPQSPSGAALTKLRASVDDAIYSLSDDAGGQTAAAFSQARTQAAQRFRTLDRTPGLANATGRETVAPEKFLDRFVLRGDVEGVANLMRQLPPNSRAEARAAVLDFLRSKAVTGVDDTAKFSQAGLNRALMTIGPRKLEIIFAGDRATLDQLRRLGRVGAYIQSPPVASGVNYSNTATTGADFLDQVSRLPVLGLLGRPGDLVRAYDVSNALSRVAPVQSRPALLPSDWVDGGALLSGRAAVPMGALSVPSVLDQPNRRSGHR